jgi:hypothetical protein
MCLQETSNRCSIKKGDFLICKKDCKERSRIDHFMICDPHLSTRPMVALFEIDSFAPEILEVLFL